MKAALNTTDHCRRRGSSLALLPCWEWGQTFSSKLRTNRLLAQYTSVNFKPQHFNARLIHWIGWHISSGRKAPKHQGECNPGISRGEECHHLLNCKELRERTYLGIELEHTQLWAGLQRGHRPQVRDFPALWHFWAVTWGRCQSRAHSPVEWEQPVWQVRAHGHRCLQPSQPLSTHSHPRTAPSHWSTNVSWQAQQTGLTRGWTPPSFPASRPGVGPESPRFSQVPRSCDVAGWGPTTTLRYASNFIYTLKHHRWHFKVVYNIYLAISLLTLVLISSSSTALAQSEHLERGLGPSGVVKLQNNEKARVTMTQLWASFQIIHQEMFWGCLESAKKMGSRVISSINSLAHQVPAIRSKPLWALFVKQPCTPYVSARSWGHSPWGEKQTKSTGIISTKKCTCLIQLFL